MKWKSIKLSKAAVKIDYGYTASSGKSGVKFLRITDIQNGKVDWASVPLCECDDIGKYALAKGDIVFTRTGATTGKSFLIEECPENAVFASYLIRVRPDSDIIDSDFLAYFFKTQNYWAQISTSATGATLPGVNGTKLKSLQIPLPPLPEQRRLASLLDRADALRRRDEALLEEYEALGRSVFLEMFGDLRVNDRNWKEYSLEELTSRLTVGYVGPLTTEYKEMGIPILRSLNVKRNSIDYKDIRFIGETFHDKLSKSKLKPGDVVSIRTGNAGVTAIVPNDLKDANCADLIVITPTNRLNSSFLSEFLNFKYGDLDNVQGLTGAIQKHFNIGAIKKELIPLPPIALQNKYAIIIENLESQKEKVRAQRVQSEALFQGLLQRAFRGDI